MLSNLLAKYFLIYAKSITPKPCRIFICSPVNDSDLYANSIASEPDIFLTVSAQNDIFLNTEVICNDCR